MSPNHPTTWLGKANPTPPNIAKRPVTAPCVPEGHSPYIIAAKEPICTKGNPQQESEKEVRRCKFSPLSR